MTSVRSNNRFEKPVTRSACNGSDTLGSERFEHVSNKVKWNMAIAETKKTEPIKTATPNGGAEKAIAKREEQAMLPYDSTEDNWQIRETGEERLYWMKEPEAVIQGLAVGTDAFEGDDGNERLFIKVQLTRPTVGVSAKDSDTAGAPQTAKKGSLIWLGITHGLLPLFKEVSEAQRVLEIAVKAVKKDDIGKGRTAWRYAYAVRPTKNLRIATSRDLARVESAFDSDGVPF